MANDKQVEIILRDIDKAHIVINGKNDEKTYRFLCSMADKYHKDEIYISYDNISNYETGEIYYEKCSDELQQFIEKLELHAAKLQDGANGVLKKDTRSSISINNTNTANANITQNISIKNTMEKIDQIPDEILAKNLKYELKGMLGELEDCKDNQEKKSKLMEVVKWLGDKAVDVTIACLPYLSQIKF